MSSCDKTYQVHINLLPVHVHEVLPIKQCTTMSLQCIEHTIRRKEDPAGSSIKCKHLPSYGHLSPQMALSLVSEEFGDNMTFLTADGTELPRTTSWTGIRYVLSEVRVQTSERLIEWLLHLLY